MCQPSGRSIPVGEGLSKTCQARQRLGVSGQPHGNHGSDTNEAMVWHTSQGNAGPNQCQTNNSHRCLWLGHQGGSSSSMQRRQRDPLKPSGILMLYSHRQHHLHCAQRHLVHMIVKGLACRMRKNRRPHPRTRQRLRGGCARERRLPAGWCPCKAGHKAACQPNGYK